MILLIKDGQINIAELNCVTITFMRVLYQYQVAKGTTVSKRIHHGGRRISRNGLYRGNERDPLKLGGLLLLLLAVSKNSSEKYVLL